ncbi:MAG: DUF4351 domain-containing protein [Rhodocyclaceae bacterium]|nr:DUF4351 domain-containing protein [Rhodocyclaceae bacterium]
MSCMTCLPTPPENAPPPAVDGASDDYDSPWKEAVERYFPEFMAFYFPAAHVQIDWTQGYAFLDQELRAVVKDAELGKRFVDKLARVTRLSGEEGWVYIHIEVQASAQTEFAERMFVYNYRLYDRYRRPVASMAVLADASEHWHPEAFGFEALGCEHRLTFPTAKLLDYRDREESLLDDANPFALVTLAHLLTQATRKDMQARFAAKWKLVQLLYRRGWDKQRVIDLFGVLDWMMTLPPHLARSLWHNVEVLEEKQKMRYVTSIERLIIEQTRQQGMQQGKLEGEALALQRLLTKRFGRIPSAIAEQIAAAQQPQVEAWFDAAIDAPNLDTIFGPTQH